MQLSKNTSGSAKSDNKMNEQKKKNIIIASVILVLLAVMISYYVKLGILKLPGSVENSKETAAVKPPVVSSIPAIPNTSANSTLNSPLITQGNSSSSSNISPTNFLDPFSGPYNLTGVIVNETGLNVAVIDGNGKSFVVTENDTIDNTWKVESISMKQVVLSYNNKKQSLTIPDNSK